MTTSPWKCLELTNRDGEDLLKEVPLGEGPCPSPGPGCLHFRWADLTKGDKAVLHRASFNLLDLVKDEVTLASGDYQVRFGFSFFRGGRRLRRPGQTSTDSGTLKFLRQEELRFGDVPVVHGRPFHIPRLILERIHDGGSWGGWDAYREVRVLQGGADSGWRNGAALSEDFQRNWLQPIRRLSPGKNYEQRGHFLDKNNVRWISRSASIC